MEGVDMGGQNIPEGLTQDQIIKYKLNHKISLTPEESTRFTEILVEERIDDQATRRGRYGGKK